MMKPGFTAPFHSSARRCPARCSGTPSARQQRLRQRALAGAEQHRLQPRPAALALDERADRRRLRGRRDRRAPRGRAAAPASAPRCRRRTAPAARAGAPVPSSLRAPRACPPPTDPPRSAAAPRRPGARSGRRGTSASRAGGSENPAAIGWPPPVVRIPAWRAAITAAPRSSPVTERPDPLARPSAIPATQAGRLNRSLIRPATMPTTPGCQAGTAHHQRRMPLRRLRSAAARSASSSIAASTSWRWRFTASSVAASVAASTGSSHSSSAQPEIGLGDPPGGVDARAEREAAGAGGRAIARLRHVEQRGDAGTRAPRHHLQPLADQRAIDTGQRHHVADRRQRDEVEQADQVGLLARVEEALRGAACAPSPPRPGTRPRPRTAVTGRSVQSSRFGLTVARIAGGGPSALW